MNKLDKSIIAREKLKQASDLENRGEFFSASFYLKDALKYFMELGDSAMQSSTKKKLIEMNKKSLEGFSKYSIEGVMPQDALRRDMERIYKLIEDDLFPTLDNIGNSQAFCPKYKKVKEQAYKNMPLHSILASNATFDHNGNIIKGSDDGEYSWLMFQYNIRCDVIKMLYLNDVFKFLIDTKKLDALKLKKYLKQSVKIPDNVLNLVNIGIDRFFEGDYVSAMHILIPQFEALFLHISEGLGIDIISLNRGQEISTQTKTLSEVHLDKDKFKFAWGEDFCEQLNFVLFRPLGYKLRHKIAHGEIMVKECNFENSILILYFYIVLISRIGKVDIGT